MQKPHSIKKVGLNFKYSKEWHHNKDLDKELSYKHLGANKGDSIHYPNMKKNQKGVLIKSKAGHEKRTKCSKENRSYQLPYSPVMTYNYNVIDWNEGERKKVAGKTRQYLIME